MRGPCVPCAPFSRKLAVTPFMGEEGARPRSPASEGLSPAQDPLLAACSLPGRLVSLQGGVPGCQARNASYVGRAGAREHADTALSSRGTPRAAAERWPGKAAAGGSLGAGSRPAGDPPASRGCSPPGRMSKLRLAGASESQRPSRSQTQDPKPQRTLVRIQLQVPGWLHQPLTPQTGN